MRAKNDVISSHIFLVVELSCSCLKMYHDHYLGLFLSGKMNLKNRRTVIFCTHCSHEISCPRARESLGMSGDYDKVMGEDQLSIQLYVISSVVSNVDQ